MKNKFFFILSIISINLFSQENITIEQAYNFALENNINIQKAKLDIESAKHKLKEITAIGLPQINAKVDYNNFIKQPVQVMSLDNIPPKIAEMLGLPTSGVLETTFGQKQNLTAGATLSQLIFNGSYLVGLQSAKVYKHISELALEKNEKLIKEAVFLTYSSVVIIDENLKLIDKNLVVANKNYKDTKEIFNVGLGEELASDQMQYNVINLESAKKNLLRNRINIINALKFLIGKDSETEINVSTSLDELIKTNENKLIDESKFNSWDENIDIKIAMNQKKASELTLKNERSKYLPSLAAFVSSSYNAFSQKFDFFDQKYYNTTVAGFSLNIPIFSSFDRKNKVSQAKIELEKSEISIKDLKNKLTKDAKEQFNSYQNALEQLNTSKKLQELSNKIYSTQQKKYYEGIGSSFELQQSEIQRNNADSSYIQAVFDVIQAKIKLDNTLNQL